MKKIQKKLINIVTMLLIASLMIISFSSCTKNDNPDETTNKPQTDQSDSVTDEKDTGELKPEDKTVAKVMVLNGTTGMGAAPLALAESKLPDSERSFDFEFATAADMVNAAVISGEADIAAVPTNVASVLYNKTKGKIFVAAVNTKGVLYILENGNSIKSFEDLKGKTVYVPGLGSNPEYVLKYLCAKKGLEVGKDITIDGTSYPNPDELATAVAAGKAKIALLPEPKVTVVQTKNSDINVSINITSEWEKVCGAENTLVQGCIIVRKEFAAEHPTVVEKFLSEYKKSIEAVLNDKDTAADAMVEMGILPEKPIALKAIPNCNICFMEGEEMKTALSYLFNALFEIEPKSIGGAIPNDEIYFQRGYMITE